MDDFRTLSAAATLERLATLPTKRRLEAFRTLIYKKSTRPDDKAEQILLLRALSESAELSRADRTYSMVAACHKASELVDRDTIAALVPPLEEALAWAWTLPERRALRKDGIHMRFSILNVLMNAGILLGLERRDDYAAQVLRAFDGLNPRKVSPYLFNSSSNIVKTVGLALLFEPARIAETSRQIRAMLYFGLRLRYANDVFFALFRRGVPGSFGEIRPDVAFGEFTGTLQRFEAMKAAGAGADPAALREIAGQCVAQVSEAQREAMLAAVAQHVAPRWQAGA